ncbi:MAG: hypothetical protein A2600_11405 [Candidatus Lambdaproteobacteria bacterium RIFOXYD1_FULL_56_27]|uniref:SCP2 domain-containing protein n=1 Tax=Candidatus Lambdaproteobacteria bacterium RIFOXYD2_FULL_56_26 TaxID=1817773 RepID=A0A1F6H0P4_9PROT|nr:MAG: hypothetical protein A2426_12595 [Candidatus Lambdaproteobacteria bacterium RIFOXYC1_FULL_56_13]OGH03977.1 MAG: hypothetical protein A2557_11165 [Candidatus Lambdaproteobacteria bacterium RIFOXYD2_FULL_56_26]OGH08368.1 MAG: hypothetical protein A2600_11405 [Candidatus Lambdaproteobacteria bacterium RIFOXYD1_FULL_56_27]
MTALTVQEIFRKVALGIEQKPEKVREVDSVFLFKISGPQGGVFHLDLKNHPGVSFEEKPAEVVLEMRDKDFIKLYNGTLPGFKAVLCGKLKIRGELALATRLSEVFFAAKSNEAETK